MSAATPGVKIGILALQGAVDPHVVALAECGSAQARPVRAVDHLADVDALVIPGGESTTMSMLLDRTGLFDAIAERVERRMPVLGTCAGMILLASKVRGGRADQLSFSAIDLDVERNGFGRQRESFEAPIAVTGDPDPFPGVFIRAPRVTRVGADVEVLAQLEGGPVWCRSESVMVTSFHPELSADRRVHRRFLAMMNIER